MKKPTISPINRAIGKCHASYSDLHKWQDCARGVNVANRLLKRVSPRAAAKAGRRICLSTEEFPGPRARCVEGVVHMARASRKAKR